MHSTHFAEFLLSEPDRWAPPTSFKAHAALWGRKATLADRSRGSGPFYSGPPGTSGSSQGTLVIQEATRQGRCRDAQAGDPWTPG